MMTKMPAWQLERGVRLSFKGLGWLVHNGNDQWFVIAIDSSGVPVYERYARTVEDAIRALFWSRRRFGEMEDKWDLDETVAGANRIIKNHVEKRRVRV